MKTMTWELQTDADGSLHLPLPKTMAHGRYRVTAKIVPVAVTAARPAAPRLTVRDALEQLAASNPFGTLADPVAWQRDVRADRALPLLPPAGG